MTIDCFLICPIGSEGSDIRKRTDQWCRHVVSPAADGFDYSVVRADEMPNPGMITNQIMDAILNSKLVIADLTDGNPNVFYELALRHACRKPFIQMIRTGGNVPFDVHGVRTISYDLADPDSIQNAGATLKRQMRSIVDGHVVDSPVSKAITEKMFQGDDNAVQVFLEKFWQLESDFESLHQSIDRVITSTNEIEDAVSTVESDVSSIESSVSNIESDVSDINEKLSGEP